MVLHANHQYRIGPQGSAYSTVTSTTAASTLRTASIRQERSCTKLAKPKHKPEPPTAQCHFRYGRAAKQVYEKGGEEITQIEWETLNKSLRKTLRMLEHRDAERQALATARLATEFKDFTPKIPCPEYASDYQALLAISRASDPRMWRKGMNDGWVDLEKQSNKVYIKEGTVAACRGVTCAPLRIADKLFRVIRELYLPGLELGDAAPPPFVQISQLRHLETLVLADNGFGAGKELANGDTYHSVLDDHLADFDLPSLKVLDLTGNGFTGAFPSNVAALTGLRTLRLGRNKLTGPLPEAWRSLRRLDTLDVHSNKLTGEALPPWLVEGCPVLRDYRAGDNRLTSLNVPGPCGLRRLELFGNDLEGPLSETIYLCAELRYLDLSKNRLTGALPVGALTSLPLTGLYLVGNRLADPQADGADVQSYLPKCLVSVDRGPPPLAAIAETAVPVEASVTSVVAEPPRLAPAPAPAPSTSLYRDDEATAPPPPDAVEDLRDELAETERRLVRALRDVEDLECEIKARRHDILAGMPTNEDVKAFGRIGRPPAAAMPVFMSLCRLVFPDEKLKDRNDDDKNWKKLRAYLQRDRNTILDAIQGFDAHDHRARLAELREQYFAEVRPEQFASRRTWATCIAETRPPISDTALVRLKAVATFCGRWLRDLPERLEMQDRIEALGEEVKELQRERRETFRRTRDLRSTADKLLETTLRNRDTPEFYSYY